MGLGYDVISERHVIIYSTDPTSTGNVTMTIKTYLTLAAFKTNHKVPISKLSIAHAKTSCSVNNKIKADKEKDIY